MQCQEKELDTFPSTYMKDYRAFKKNVKSNIIYPVDTFALPEEEKDNYIRMKKEKLGSEELESVKQLYLERLQSTYQVSYNCNLNKDEDLLGKDTMMVESRKLYYPPCKKLLPPVPSSRRVLGYCRPSLYYTELSEYQGTYSYLGYSILNTLEEQGISRLAPRAGCR